MIQNDRLKQRLEAVNKSTKLRRKLANKLVAERSGQIIQESESLKNPVLQTQKEIINKLEEQRKDALDREIIQEEKRLALITKQPCDNPEEDYVSPTRLRPAALVGLGFV